jgi:tripartite ATP-independent transporter DctP family solute receptor
MKRILGLLTATAAVGLIGGAAAQAQVSLRFGWATTASETDSYNFAAHRFSEALEKAAPGGFKVSFFPNRQLGDEKEMMQGLRLGTVDVAVITNPVIANVEPAFLVNDLPFLYAGPEQVYATLDGKLGAELFDLLKAKGVVGLGWCDSGFRNMANKTRPIIKPEDVHGVKFRVLESPIFVGMFQRLGGTAVPMPWGELFTALQQGAVDGMEAPTWAIQSAKMNEVTRYLSVTRHIYSASPLLMSARTFGKLDAAQQQAVRKAAVQSCDEQRAFNAKLEGSIFEALTKSGMELNEVKDTQTFRSKMGPLYAEYRDKIGAERMDRWLAAVKQ